MTETETVIAARITGFGRYNLLTKLGQGGMGAVYLARQKSLRRYCAIKVINASISQDPASTERFLREARATASFAHPNLISIFDCDRFRGQSFIAMEYVEGMSLAEIIRAHGALPVPLAFHWLMQAATALEYIHGRHVIHRDIKPDNMMIDGKANLKIMDLGLAKDHLEADQGMTVTGMIMGSPHYMSPEQINDSKTADHRSDLYSLGISFFQMLTGRVPFQHSSSSLVCIAHLQEPIPTLNLASTDLSVTLDGLIGKMTAKNKEERFQSAPEILAAFQSWAASNPTDEVSQQFFSNLGFEERSVSHILATQGVPVSEVDIDFAEIPPLNEAQVQTPTLPPIPTINEFRGPIPPVAPPAPKKSPLKRVAIGFAGCLLFLIALSLINHSKNQAPKKDFSTLPRKGQPPKPQPPVPPPLPEPIAKLGSLLVRTQPEKAIVMLGSKSLPSPAAFSDVPAGKYTVLISLDGYQDVQKDVTVEENRPSDVQVALTPLAKQEEPKPPPNPNPPNEQNPQPKDPIDNWVGYLDKAGQVPDNQWPAAKQRMLEGVKRFFDQKGIQGQVADATLADVGKYLDQARALPPDATAQKEKLARNIVWTIGEAMARNQGRKNTRPGR